MRVIIQIAILIIIAVEISYGQLSGTYTVGSGGNYETIQAAVAALNSSGVGSGGVTFNVAAGHTENTTAIISITRNRYFFKPNCVSEKWSW